MSDIPSEMARDPSALQPEREVRAPSGWRLEQAISAWQQLCATLASDPELFEDENAIATGLQNASADDPRDLLARLIDATVWAEREATWAKELKDQYTDRQRRYEKRVEDMRATIEQVMSAIELDKFRAKLARVSIVEAPQSLLVTDEGLIPDEWFKVERSLRRRDLHNHIKETGEIVPGAVLTNGGAALRMLKVR